MEAAAHPAYGFFFSSDFNIILLDYTRLHMCLKEPYLKLELELHILEARLFTQF